jgi:pimeloyl-ACP methyl ester carboxylesterase
LVIERLSIPLKFLHPVCNYLHQMVAKKVRAILCVILSFISLYSCHVHAKTHSDNANPHDLVTVKHSVGFQLLEEQDASRVVTGGVLPTTVHPRPVRTYIWYPAKSSDNTKPMRFGRYAELANEDVWPVEIGGNMRTELKYSSKVLARSLGPERFEQLLQQPVNAIEMADALNGPFPLVVIGQGLYYESPVVFAALGEFLAERGFVVATCPLVGTNSPIVRMDIQDLETQVRDLEFVIARVRRLPFVSPDKLGVFGFDMGGMAGLILTMRNADVDAFASVSSGILYERPDGIPANSPHYDPQALRVPWFHSVPVYWMKPADSKVESLFDTARHAERYLLLTKGLGHVDYTSYALIPGRRAMSGYWAASNPEVAKDHDMVNRYIANFFAAFLKQDLDSLEFLSQEPIQIMPGSSMTLERQPADPTLITYEEFVLAVLNGEAEQATEKIRALIATTPDHALLKEANLERLVWSLRDTWGFSEKVMPVIQFRAELFPRSDGAQRMLAEGYVGVSNYPAAIETYKKLFEQIPDDKDIKARLEWLQQQ